MLFSSWNINYNFANEFKCLLNTESPEVTKVTRVGFLWLCFQIWPYRSTSTIAAALCGLCLPMLQVWLSMHIYSYSCLPCPMLLASSFINIHTMSWFSSSFKILRLCAGYMLETRMQLHEHDIHATSTDNRRTNLLLQQHPFWRGIPQIRHCHTQHRTFDFTTLTLRYSTLEFFSSHSYFPPTLTFSTHTHLFATTLTHIAEISTPSLAIGDGHVTRHWVACTKLYKVQWDVVAILQAPIADKKSEFYYKGVLSTVTTVGCMGHKSFRSCPKHQNSKS